MERERYTVRTNEDHTLFEFISQGPVGDITKIVLYQHWGGEVYNLAFGDYEETTGWFNDTSRSNNGDMKKVLATVAHTLLTFLQHYPNAEIKIQGSSQARTRLYQMQLVLNIRDISSQFSIKGYFEGNWETFKKGKNYESFSISNKKRSKFGY